MELALTLSKLETPRLRSIDVCLNQLGLKSVKRVNLIVSHLVDGKPIVRGASSSERRMFQEANAVKSRSKGTR